MQRNGNFSQAIADYHRSLAYAPRNRRTLAFLADAYRKQGTPQKALTVLHSWNDTYAPGEQPAKLDYLFGLTYQELGCYEQALVCLDRAIRRSTPSAESLYQVARTQMLIGSPSGAAQAARHALALNPPPSTQPRSASPPGTGRATWSGDSAVGGGLGIWDWGRKKG